MSAVDNGRGRRPRTRRHLAITAASSVAVGGGSLAAARFTPVDRLIMHLSVPHAVLDTLIITAGVVAVVLGWLVVRYLAQRDRHSREIIELMQDRCDVGQEYEDKLPFSSTRYVSWPMEATKGNEKSPPRLRPRQAGKAGEGTVVPLNRHRRADSGTRPGGGTDDPAEGFPPGGLSGGGRDTA